MTHEGFDGETETYRMVRGGWAPIFDGLKTLLETGAPLHLAPPFDELSRLCRRPARIRLRVAKAAPLRQHMRGLGPASATAIHRTHDDGREHRGDEDPLGCPGREDSA